MTTRAYNLKEDSVFTPGRSTRLTVTVDLFETPGKHVNVKKSFAKKFALEEKKRQGLGIPVTFVDPPQTPLPSPSLETPIWKKFLSPEELYSSRVFLNLNEDEDATDDEREPEPSVEEKKPRRKYTKRRNEVADLVNTWNAINEPRKRRH